MVFVTVTLAALPVSVGFASAAGTTANLRVGVAVQAASAHLIQTRLARPVPVDPAQLAPLIPTRATEVKPVQLMWWKADGTRGKLPEGPNLLKV